MERCLSVLIVILLSTWVQVNAQLPMVTVYNSDTYGASERNWATVQDSLNIIYVANDDGVLVYNGNEWDLIPVPGRQARSMASDSDGVIYVGTANNFGRIGHDERGQKIYVSLSDELPEDQQPIWVFETRTIGKRAYFQTQHAIYTYHPAEGITIINHDEVLISSFEIRNTFYFHDSDNLFRLINNESHFVRPIIIDDTDDSIYSILPYQGDEYLILSEQGKFYKTKGGLRGEIIPFQTEISQIEDSLELYLGNAYSDEFYELLGGRIYLIPNDTKGLYIINQSGNILYYFDANNHLTDSSIEHIYIDNERNIWLSTHRNIYKLNTALPVRYFDNSFGFNPNVNDLLYFQDKIYAATNNGIYVKPQHQDFFELIDGTQSQIWKLVTNGEYIIAAGGNRGTFLIKDDKVVDNLSWSKSTMMIAPSTTHENVFHIGKFNGYKIVLHDGNSLIEIPNTPEINSVIRSIYEDDNGKVWLGTPLQGLFSYPMTTLDSLEHISIKHYGIEDGFDVAEHNFVFEAAHGPLFSSRNYMFNFDEDRQKFRRVSGDRWTMNQNPYPILKSMGNDMWILSDKRKLIFSGEGLQEDHSSLRAINADIRDVISVSGNYYLATSNGIYVIPHRFRPDDNKMGVIITRITSTAMPETIYSNALRKKLPIQLPYNNPEFAISFSKPSFVLEDQIKYRYKLEGLSTSWSPWRESSEAIFTGLSSGNYSFTVQARDAFGNVSSASTIPIIVQTPAYLTNFAIFIYIVLFIGLVIGFIKANNYRLLKRNEFLESLIMDRTDEIVKQNEKLIEANKTKSRFLSIAAHDMRNPLGIIQGYTDLIRENAGKNSEIQELTNHIQSITDKMLNMINEILNPETDRNKNLPFFKVKVELRSMISQIITHNRVIANRKNQQIFTKLHETCPVMGDRGRLYEIFDNIINNAIKYSPPEGIIVIQLRPITEKGKYTKIQFSVSDRGPGVAESERNAIFGDYATSNNKTTAGEHSTGLGLGIVKQLVEIHNGSVWVEDNPNHDTGAKFVVELPCISDKDLK